MKKSLLLLVFISIFHLGFAQNSSNLSVELNRPIALGDNVTHNYFKGMVGVSAQYKIWKADRFNLSAALNVTHYRSNLSSYALIEEEGPFICITPMINNKGYCDGLSFILAPNVVAGYDLSSRWTAMLGIGYAVQTFGLMNKSDHDLSMIYESMMNKPISGVQFTSGLKFRCFRSIFIQSSFDYTRYSKPSTYKEMYPSLRSMNLKFGVGYDF